MTTPRPRVHDSYTWLAVVGATTAVGCFVLAWIAGLWLFVLAIPGSAVLMLKHWLQTRWRLLPRIIAVEAVVSVDDTWEDNERAALTLALAGGVNVRVLEAAAPMISRITSSTELQRRAQKRLGHAAALLKHPPLASLVSPPPAPTRWVAVTLAAAMLGTILWTAPTSRWWLIPLGVGFTVLASTLHDRIEHHKTTKLVAHAAIETPASSETDVASPRRLAQSALGQPAALRRAHQLIADTALPPDIQLVASERLHEAIAHTQPTPHAHP